VVGLIRSLYDRPNQELLAWDIAEMVVDCSRCAVCNTVDKYLIVPGQKCTAGSGSMSRLMW
jgi:hypothetical protein